MRFQRAVLAACMGIAFFSGGVLAQDTNLLALGEGALPVAEAPCYGSWSAVNMLDDSAASAWACQEGEIAKNAFVFELVASAVIESFEFDTASIDGDGRGAKDVVVEVSDVSKNAGFETVLRTTLADRQDGQRFPATKKTTGRWVRLTLVNNHGDSKYTELNSFRAYGSKPSARAITPITGTYSTSYDNFHVRQQGTAISGCYESHQGLFEGTIEGRVAKLTFDEGGGSDRGPAVFVFAPDGKSFRGYWWHNTDKGRAVDGEWLGQRISDEVGGCPHWSGSVGGELKKDLAATGRARLYGILFDTDSAHIRAESLPTLDEVVRVLSSETSWSLTIEGHTDSTGTAAHNQTLSEQRAKAVMEYLTGKGIASGRLTAVGFGQSRPLADNATELGRAQNRRVELVKK